MVRSLTFFYLIFFTGLCTFAQEDSISFTQPQKLTDKVNSAAEESLPILSPDGKKLYVARTYHPNNTGGKFSGQDIWVSTITEGEFSKSEQLNELNDQWSNVVVGVSSDGKHLYLLNQKTSETESIPGVSRSVYDSENDEWGAPLPVEIPELEVEGTFYSVYVDPNEDFILWSLPTAEEDSLGNDLYISTSENEGWSAPMSLGAAINTDLNEISPFYDPNTELLFFSSNSRDPENYDIYYAKRQSDDWQDWSLPVNAEFNSTDFDAYFILHGDSSGYFASNRNDSLSNIYITNIIITPPADEIEEVEEIVEADTIQVPEKEPVLIVETGGEESKDRNLDEMTREELLDVNTRIRFVYFEYDKYNITAKYIEVLDDVAEILDKNQDLMVSIEGHTDAVASDAYNQVLSENRAASVKEWLVINGIDPDRIKTAGYGERDPYATNATEEGRALNRRVEIFFKVME